MCFFGVANIFLKVIQLFLQVLQRGVNYSQKSFQKFIDFARNLQMMQRSAGVMLFVPL